MRPAPRLCLITPSFPPWQWGGLAASAGRVAGYARDLGLEVHVALARPTAGAQGLRLDELCHDHRQDGLLVHCLDLPPAQHDPAQRQPWDGPHAHTLRVLGQCLELLHRLHGFDLLHSFFVYPMGYVAGTLAGRLGMKHMTTAVGDDLNRLAHSPELLAPLRLALGRARAAVFLSQGLREMAAALAELPPLSPVILNSVELPARPWRAHPGRREWVLGCAGKFKWSKGLPYLIEAFRRLPAEAAWRLEVVGGLPQAEARDLASLGDRARLSPPLAPAEVPAWLKSLDAFALPSLSEGCPNLLMEAMACGLPCLATAVGAVPQLMQDGVSGLMAPWGDPAALAAALIRLRGEEGLAPRLGAAARRSMRRFGREGERRQWQELYRQVLSL